jgi:rare lipoprotein A
VLLRVIAAIAAACASVTLANAEPATPASKQVALVKPLAARHMAKATVKADPVRPASIEVGYASVYCFRNGPTASGERSRPAVLTAAHKTLPFGTLVEVTNQKNGRSIVVRINDRGPFVAGRVIDLTPAAARALKFDGVAPVAVRVLNNRRDLHLANRAI